MTRKQRLLMPFLLTLPLIACSGGSDGNGTGGNGTGGDGGGGGNDGTATGVLIDGLVSGVSYETPTKRRCPTGVAFRCQ